MIASLTGNVASIRNDTVVIEVGGVGLAVSCAPRLQARLRIGQSATVSTSLVVREDSLTLFGFVDDDERHVFEVLQTATGVGPRVAQAVLATHTPDAVRRAIATADVKALTLVPGIGTKGAQRMLVELKDRLVPSFGDVVPAAVIEGGPAVGQVREALLGLGTKPTDADEAIRTAIEDDPNADAATMLKTALRSLDRHE